MKLTQKLAKGFIIIHLNTLCSFFQAESSGKKQCIFFKESYAGKKGMKQNYSVRPKG
ncbi:MAG: hypothetical protein WDO19_00800 [Bacteroidota bacterium]